MVASPSVVMGASGSGESTVGAALAQRLRVPFADAAVLLPRQRRRVLADQGVLRDERQPAIKSWSVMETILSVTGLVLVLLLGIFI
ncbi:hypothetical protein ASG82_05990 [Mycobacterium sp. Soil538]|nr:hypothetical protein ASG82_05990 [Mycobacterium sp. Soil538]